MCYNKEFLLSVHTHTSHGVSLLQVTQHPLHVQLVGVHNISETGLPQVRTSQTNMEQATKRLLQVVTILSIAHSTTLRI